MEFHKDELILKWFSIRNISPATRKNYNIALKEYSTFTGLTPHELIENAGSEEKDDLPLYKRNIALYLITFKIKLIEDGKASSTINLYLAAVKSFYKTFNLTLPDVKSEKTSKSPKIIKASRKDIKRLLDVSKPREKAIISLMAMSGMGVNQIKDVTIKMFFNSVSDSLKFKLKNIYDIFKNEEQILEEVLTIEMISKKDNHRYHTFIPPEVTHNIYTYLQERCFGSNHNIRINSLEEPLFLSVLGHPLTNDAISTIIRRNAYRAGLNKVTNNSWTSQALLKFFTNTINISTHNQDISKYLRGHKIRKHHAQHFYNHLADLKEYYLHLIPQLSINTKKMNKIYCSNPYGLKF
jgi:site-specific recombinase XerC